MRRHHNQCIRAEQGTQQPRQTRPDTQALKNEQSFEKLDWASEEIRLRTMKSFMLAQFIGVLFFILHELLVDENQAADKASTADYISQAAWGFLPAILIRFMFDVFGLNEPSRQSRIPTLSATTDKSSDALLGKGIYGLQAEIFTVLYSAVQVFKHLTPSGGLNLAYHGSHVLATPVLWRLHSKLTMRLYKQQNKLYIGNIEFMRTQLEMSLTTINARFDVSIEHQSGQYANRYERLIPYIKISLHEKVSQLRGDQLRMLTSILKHQFDALGYPVTLHGNTIKLLPLHATDKEAVAKQLEDISACIPKVFDASWQVPARHFSIFTAKKDKYELAFFWNMRILTPEHDASYCRLAFDMPDASRREIVLPLLQSHYGANNIRCDTNKVIINFSSENQPDDPTALIKNMTKKIAELRLAESNQAVSSQNHAAINEATNAHDHGQAATTQSTAWWPSALAAFMRSYFRPDTQALANNMANVAAETIQWNDGTPHDPERMFTWKHDAFHHFEWNLTPDNFNADEQLHDIWRRRCADGANWEEVSSKQGATVGYKLRAGGKTGGQDRPFARLVSTSLDGRHQRFCVDSVLSHTAMDRVLSGKIGLRGVPSPNQIGAPCRPN